ncbi:spermidine/putrescine ABC transporter ATP-binding protein PotA [Ketobacter sp. MCCC 1A13808]|uniref:spermidine/putrescine ABC transporter ATP-binding protein PotA n=1 Tax=Ketobacter sp. MCCC 1A13808 TaxID=2602738 RepID=UPI0013228964|nr:spermidine/putrescine ABC transporter ATP-binding protein PotA [Ketobacter sp. MCCC 1A13808]MVF13257.1 spermidine/putrescine ABC transporter ATP-binding protein PotA [Ketobacter sp. MCCC 1A13808]
MTQNPIIQLTNVTKRFDTQVVLSAFNLTIHDGEFFTILGPSGCGKTTVLRLIAGFEQSDEGQLVLAGQDLTGTPAEKRPVNTVFQSYALFPHLSVFDNVAFGLRMAKTAKAEIQKRVEGALEMVQLQDFAQRKPEQLSGGQKQRVAIARAVVNNPKVLLLDESLSALDYKLRLQMQMELKRLQRKLGITFVYVTHDQEEALSMSDRVLVMQGGLPQQVGTPRQIYESPNNLFVAQFIGEINVFDAVIDEVLDEYRFKATLTNGAKREIRADRRFEAGDEVHVLIRPEDLRIEFLKDAGDRPGFTGKILERSYTGQTLDSLIELSDGQHIQASEFFDEDDPDFDYRINEQVWVDWVHGWEHVIPREA